MPANKIKCKSENVYVNYCDKRSIKKPLRQINEAAYNECW